MSDSPGRRTLPHNILYVNHYLELELNARLIHSTTRLDLTAGVCALASLYLGKVATVRQQVKGSRYCGKALALLQTPHDVARAGASARYVAGAQLPAGTYLPTYLPTYLFCEVLAFEEGTCQSVQSAIAVLSHVKFKVVLPAIQ